MLDRIMAFYMTVITVLGSLLGIGAYNTDYEVFSDIAYSDASERNVLDLYIPAAAYDREENGFILFIHGGSWATGNKEDKAADCIEAAAKGYVAATMSFTLRSGETADGYAIDTVLDEIGLAIAKVKEFAAEKGVNVTKVAPSGYSSGAHLAMMYSYARVDESPVAIAFTANRVGPSDFSAEAWGPSGPSLARSLAGKEVVERFTAEGREDEIVAYVSPVTYVTGDSVPSLFGYGALDVVVPAGNRESIVNAFKNAGAEYDFVFYPVSGHGLKLNHITPAAKKYSATLFAYCEKYF
ncbi:MAG: alpha/beta hydrolase [Clostridia bacterium]|nr:alpha/beta hydrolase [Clostridia bacterium]